MKCSVCGKKNPRNARFCLGCGNELELPKSKRGIIVMLLVGVLFFGGMYIRDEIPVKKIQKKLGETNSEILSAIDFSPEGKWYCIENYNIASEFMMYNDGTLYAGNEWGNFYYDEEECLVVINFGGNEYVGEIKTDGEYVVMIVGNCAYSNVDIQEWTDFYKAVQKFY